MTKDEKILQMTIEASGIGSSDELTGDAVERFYDLVVESLANTLPTPIAKVCPDLDGCIGWNPSLTKLPEEGTPLYTTPPQRQPLTDFEIVEALMPVNVLGEGYYLRIARAIEAAHGIGKKT